VLQDRLTYEIMRTEDVGAEGSQIVLGKHSGRHAFRQAVADLGFELSEEEMARVFARFKDLADRKKEIATKDIEALVATELHVSATPPELLRAGAGRGTDLFRELEIDPAVPEGVLHVTAKAASCDVVPLGPDGEPDPEAFPACHLASQDWGVPVRVVPAGDAGQGPLTLPLRG
jgi:hypothetical protein